MSPAAIHYEIRPLSMAETLDAGFQLLKNHFALLSILSLIGQLPSIGVFMMFGWMLDPFAFQSGEIPDIGATFILAMCGWVLGLIIILPIVIGAITAAVSDLYLGAELSVGAALQRGLDRMFPLMITYVIFSLILAVAMGVAAVLVGMVAVGFAALLEGSAIGIVLLVLLVLAAIPAFIAFAGLMTLVPGILAAVVVLEGRSLFDAIARTFSLVSGALWRFTGIGLVLYMLLITVPTGVQFMLGTLPVVGAVVWGLVQALCQAYLYATTVVAYFDVRCRMESFDLEHLAQLVEGNSPSAAPLG
jgi:hypothetical protein